VAGKPRPLLYLWLEASRTAPGLIASDRLVLRVIADHMNKDGDNAFMSIPTIVAGTALHKATVLGSLAWLRESGWLGRTSRGRRKTPIHWAGLEPANKTRKDRADFMAARREASKRRAETSPHREKRVAALAASGSKSRTDSVGLKGDWRVGLNGHAEWVYIDTHEVPREHPVEGSADSRRSSTRAAAANQQQASSSKGDARRKKAGSKVKTGMDEHKDAG
jgi:hypothetical protein